MLLFATDIGLPAMLAGHRPILDSRELGRSQVWLRKRPAGDWDLDGRMQKGALLGGTNASPGWSAPHRRIWTYDLILITTQSASNEHVDLVHSTWKEKAQPRSL